MFAVHAGDLKLFSDDSRFRVVYKLMRRYDIRFAGVHGSNRLRRVWVAGGARPPHCQPAAAVGRDSENLRPAMLQLNAGSKLPAEASGKPPTEVHHAS